MNIIDAINVLIEEELPIPLEQCDNCYETMFKQNNWIQCDNCGTTSTEYGGIFTHHTLNKEFVELCNKSKNRLSELL